MKADGTLNIRFSGQRASLLGQIEEDVLDEEKSIGSALPASVLADLTGISISISTAERWSQWARRYQAAYVGQRAADDREDLGSRKPAKQTT